MLKFIRLFLQVNKRLVEISLQLVNLGVGVLLLLLQLVNLGAVSYTHLDVYKRQV